MKTQILISELHVPTLYILTILLCAHIHTYVNTSAMIRKNVWLHRVSKKQNLKLEINFMDSFNFAPFWVKGS